jgi:hypothetical protein
MKKLPNDIKNMIINIINANNKQNFIHKIKGLKDGGKFEYAFKHQLSEIRVKSTIDKREVIDVKMKNVGTNKQIMHINTVKNRTATIIINNKLGIHNDHIQVTLKRVPLQKEKGFEINIKPGLGDIEIITPNISTNIPINVESIIDGKKVTRDFNLPINGGARLNKALLLDQKIVHFSKIDHVFGQVIERKFLK